MYVLVVSRRGVNEEVVVRDEDAPLLDMVRRWEPDVRLGRVAWQDFGYKRAVVIRNGLCTYELFKTAGS